MVQMPSGPRQPFWGEIKQVQLLMVLLSCLPPDGKLREVLGMALEVPQSDALARVTPCAEVSTDGLRSWLTTIWGGEHGAEMQALVDWQKNGENVKAAVKELLDVEDRLGFTLSIVKRD
jgi:hypothetical protein